jgi:pSer/pThr/pTyr-binding forkhead associated (FHA) protein
MACVTLRVLDGANRGTIFQDVPTPITIGREEGNIIQLNDDRVSRFHLKIQEDEGQVVLTDLDSTNGTRVNGEHTQLRIIRPGDLIVLGRSILLVGTRQQIRQRLATMDNGQPELVERYDQLLEQFDRPSSSSLDWDRLEDLEVIQEWRQPPQLPQALSPGQSAQLAEILEYLLARVRHLLTSAQPGPSDTAVQLELAEWQNLIDIQARLANYLRRIGEPNDSE